jgi:hypothetical protein
LPLQDAGVDEDLEVMGDGGLAETNGMDYANACGSGMQKQPPQF